MDRKTGSLHFQQRVENGLVNHEMYDCICSFSCLYATLEPHLGFPIYKIGLLSQANGLFQSPASNHSNLLSDTVPREMSFFFCYTTTPIIKQATPLLLVFFTHPHVTHRPALLGKEDTAYLTCWRS